MEHEFSERRRSPRVSTECGTIAALHVAVPVRLLDLSSDGLLLACDVPLRVGATVRVVTRLAGRRLEVELCVRHVSRRRDEGVGGYVYGGSFPSFDQTARHTIAALLGENGLARPPNRFPGLIEADWSPRPVAVLGASALAVGRNILGRSRRPGCPRGLHPPRRTAAILRRPAAGRGWPRVSFA